MIDLNDYGPPSPPVSAVITDTGLGKTRAWRKTVAASLVAQGLHPVLAVPRHQLGEEVVADLAEAGITACVYRGRDAEDPKAPRQKMCREQERIGVISQALGSVPTRACKNREKQCKFFAECGYQRQRQERPQVWVIPHQLLFQERPDFIPQPDALAIDESFWDAALRGLDSPVKLWLRSLVEDRYVPRDIEGTADLIAISRRMHTALMRENSGRIRRSAIVAARVNAADLRGACQLEWQRKRQITEVYPAMPLKEVQAICRAVADHNQEVKRLATFWKLLTQTLEGEPERSPWLERIDEPLPFSTRTEPAVRMAWRENIHPSWRAPTTIMDATMPVEIVRQFFPEMPDPIRISAPAPHTRVRQIVDRPMSASMLIPSERANDRTNQTRQNNDERLRHFVEVRANEMRPGRILVVCQLGLESELLKSALPDNVVIRHFNDIAGENSWNDIALLIVIGRTEPPPETVERIAWVVFGTEIAELQQGQRYPRVKRGLRMRDGGIVAVEGNMHPDERAEAVRWAICEAGIMQAIGRGRAINRSATDPLQIDILTNFVLPIEVDELTTWDLIQPSLAEIMRARGAVPVNYRDMAAAYPDLFSTGEAARKALERENPGQMPLGESLIGVCPGFSAIGYRRAGSRGPASTFLFDPKRVNPMPWLTERIGEIAMKGPARSVVSGSFKQYLRGRRPSNTPVTEFVEDALRDRQSPDAKTWQQLHSYLRRRGADADVIAAARSVWRQYRARHRHNGAGAAGTI